MKNGAVERGDSYIEGLRMLHRRDGVQDWTLTARRADLTAAGDRALLSDITVAFADRGVTVRAERGSFGLSDRRIAVDGRVVAQGENFSLTAEGAVMDSASGTLQTSGPVLVEGKKFRVQGRGMQAAESGQTVRILHDVTAVFNN